jgi:hypothetical protein
MNIEPDSGAVSAAEQRSLIALFETDTLFDSTCRPFDDHILLAYIDAELNGQDAGTLYPEFRAHLQQVPECQQEYAELKHLLLLERQGQLVEPPTPGKFDWSFLPASVTPARGVEVQSIRPRWQFDAVGRLILVFSDEIVHALQAPTSQLDYALQRSEQGSHTRYEFALREEIDDLHVAITVRDNTSQPDQYTLIVETEIPSRGGWPHLGDTAVTLKRDDKTLDTQWTDPFGKAVFEHIPSGDLADLRIEIAPA